MALKSLFPVFVTARLAEARDFYVQHIGFHVVFEADWYVQLHGFRGDSFPAVQLAFMLPGVADQPAAMDRPKNQLNKLSGQGSAAPPDQNHAGV